MISPVRNTYASPGGRRSQLRFFLGLVVVCTCCQARPTLAQQVEVQDPAADEAAIADVQVRPVVDLGRFQLRDLRPVSNVTAKLTFTMYLALPHSIDENTVAELERWQHRLRDQVIISVRKTETKDFLEPDLSLLRRNIVLRINRLLKVALVEEVLLTEFTFTTN